jgi:hypothetical protein
MDRSRTEPCRVHRLLRSSARSPRLLQLLLASTMSCHIAPGMPGLPLSCRLQKSKPGLLHGALLRDEGGKGGTERAGIGIAGI